jgi:peptidoglycan/LPS O-acetylase OafA/YrhL
MAAGALVYPPQDYLLLAKSAKAAALFYANFFFHGQAGYFAPDAEAQPLLHTWSLAVEEQFYLVAPLFLWAIARLARSWQVALVALVFVASLAFSVAGAMSEDGSGAFYLPHTRAFELIMGMMLAMGLAPRLPSQTAAEAVGAAGLVMIAFAVLGFSDATPFPGYAALAPCVGAALIIASGAGHSTFVSRMLATAPMVFTGKISYSLYLWHWPIFVFAAYQWGELSVLDRVGLIVAAYLLSVLTYWFVEQPARQRTPFLTRKRVFIGGAAALALAYGVTQLALGARGLPQRLGPQVAAFDEAVRKNRGFTPCPENEAWLASTSDCEIGNKAAPEPAFLLWGDSHARVVASTVAELAEQQGSKGLIVFRGGCPPFLTYEESPFDTGTCAKTASLAETLLKGKGYKNVVLVARWANYAQGGGYRNGRWYKTTFDQGDLAKNQAAFEAAMTATVESIIASGRTVTIVGPVPDLKLNPPDTIMRAMMHGATADVRATFADFETRQTDVLALLKRLEQRPGVRVVYPHRSLCDAQVCRTMEGMMPLYSDDNHLGVNGVALIRRELGAAIAPFDAAPPR